MAIYSPVLKRISCPGVDKLVFGLRLFKAMVLSSIAMTNPQIEARISSLTYVRIRSSLIRGKNLLIVLLVSESASPIAVIPQYVLYACFIMTERLYSMKRPIRAAVTVSTRPRILYHPSMRTSANTQATPKVPRVGAVCDPTNKTKG